MTPMLFKERVVISAPFGNYLSYEGAISTLGTFTREKRDGIGGWYKWWRVLKTLRRYKKLGAWVNKLGLPNPGLPWLIRKANAWEKEPLDLSKKIISIHGFNDDDWKFLIDESVKLRPLAIELNLSCPNVTDDPTSYFSLFKYANQQASGHTGVILKLPPINYAALIGAAVPHGLRTFHCCNTLPVPGGGMSGKPLKPVSINCIRHIYDTWSPIHGEPEIIGGGGITGLKDCMDYFQAGANHVAFGTMLFEWKNRRLVPNMVKDLEEAW